MSDHQYKIASIIQRAKTAIISSSVGSRLLRGAFWTIAGSVISRGFALVSSVIIARVLGKEGFGEFAIIQSTTLMFQAFSNIGIGMTLTKYIAEYRESDPLRAGRIVALSTVVALISGSLAAIVLIVISPWLAKETLNAPHLNTILQYSAVMLILTSIIGVQNGILLGFESFKSIARLNVVNGLLLFVLSAAGTVIAGLKGAIIGNIIALFINWIINKLAVSNAMSHHNISYTLSGWRTEWRILYNYSLPSACLGLIVIPFQWYCTTLLAKQPGGYAEIGIYNAAAQWGNAFGIITDSLGMAIVPIFSNIATTGDKSLLKATLKKSVLISTASVIPLLIIGSILSPFIMRIYGASYQSGWPTLTVVLITTGIISIQLAPGRLAQSLGRVWPLVWMGVIWGILYVIATHYFLQNGAFGFASARLLAFIIHTFMIQWFVYRYITK